MESGESCAIHGTGFWTNIRRMIPPDSCCLFSIQGAAAPKRCTTVSPDLPGKRYLRRMPMWGSNGIDKVREGDGKRPPVPIP